MSKYHALRLLNDEPSLQISYSQIFTYLSCSLKYRFQYVEKRAYERTSSTLFFGSAMHKALEKYYRAFLNNGTTVPLSILEELFEESVCMSLDKTDIPVIFKKEAPDREGLISLGKSLLKTFHDNVDLTGYRIVDVEMPLSSILLTEEGYPTDFRLVGVIDLLLMNNQEELVIVDNKTSKQTKSQNTIDEDLQFSAYSYLAVANNLTIPTVQVKCRMDVLRKLKKPKLEYYHTVRSVFDRKRFVRIANSVLDGIDNQVFIPNKSWLCADCPFLNACKEW